MAERDDGSSGGWCCRSTLDPALHGVRHGKLRALLGLDVAEHEHTLVPVDRETGEVIVRERWGTWLRENPERQLAAVMTVRKRRRRRGARGK